MSWVYADMVYDGVRGGYHCGVSHRFGENGVVGHNAIINTFLMSGSSMVTHPS